LLGVASALKFVIPLDNLLVGDYRTWPNGCQSKSQKVFKILKQEGFNLGRSAGARPQSVAAGNAALQPNGPIPTKRLPKALSPWKSLHWIKGWPDVAKPN
jgi:hypothetical protein